MTSRPKLLYFITEDWYFFSHRLPIARAALRAGFDVVLLARTGEKCSLIEAEGIRVIPLDIRRGGTNPLRELIVLWKVVQIYRRERPCIVHQVAMKPVLYGSLAAR